MAFLRVLRRRYCFRMLSGSWIGRLPMAMAAVAIPLALRHAGADYVFIGAAAGSYAISSAIGAPVIGRIVDRIGQVKVLVPTALLAAAGFVVIAVAPALHAAVLTGAILAGAFTPPLEPCLRVLWPGLVGKDELDDAYAVDSAAQELIFVVGPLAVSLCVAVVVPIAALWAEAALMLLGVLVFATALPARQWCPEQGHDRHWLGPLRRAGLLILLTLNSAASLVGVLIYGAITWTIQPRTRVLLFACRLAAGYGLLPIVPSPPLMAVLMVPAGFFLAPLLAATFSLIGDLAPPGTVTEAFAWLVTLFTAGESAGAAIVGPVLDRGDLHWAAAYASLGAAACLLLVIAGYRLIPAQLGSAERAISLPTGGSTAGIVSPADQAVVGPPYQGCA